MTVMERREYNREWRKNNQEKCRASQKRYNDANRERIRAYQIRRKEQIANAFRLRAYGLTKENYKALLVKQNNTCAICREITALEVDHSHRGGFVRGLLCQSCNLGLGNFKESFGSLAAAMRYLSGRVSETTNINSLEEPNESKSA